MFTFGTYSGCAKDRLSIGSLKRKPKSFWFTFCGVNRVSFTLASVRALSMWTVVTETCPEQTETSARHTSVIDRRLQRKTELPSIPLGGTEWIVTIGYPTRISALRPCVGNSSF